MNDAKKTNQQLIEELVALRQQLAAQDDEKASSSAPSLESLQNQVIGRVRDEIRKMRHSQDVEPLLTATWDGLRALGVPFAVCGVNIINEHTDPPSIVVYHKFSHGELQQYHAPFTEDSSLHRIWRRRQVAYRPDLQQEDPYGEGSIRSLGFRSVVDVPFSHGTLAVSNKDPGAFSERDLEKLQAFAEVLSEGFRRQQDLQDLEQHNRSLQALNLEQQREYDLRERENAVRLQIALMEHPFHLWDVIDVIGLQLKELSIDHDSCSVQIVNQEGTDFISVGGDRPKDWDKWLSVRREMHGIDLAAGLSWSKSTIHAEIYPWVIEVWRSGTARYEPCIPEGGMPFPGYSLVDVPFRQGTLSINCARPHAFDAADIALLERFAGVLSEGFSRFEDMLARWYAETERKKMAEATALSLSVQRVRHEIIQMKERKDWENIVGILDRELRKWVEFNNCGIKIIDVSAPRWDDYTRSDGALQHREQEEVSPEMRRALETGEPLYRTDREGMILWPESEKNLRSVVDLPFHGGTLAVDSTQENAFGPRDFHKLEPFAQVMAEGAQRLEDLNTMAAQEKQLRQVQKMEAVGQLAAGIAHNFNNMLQIAIGNIDLGLMQMPEKLKPLFEDAFVALRRAADMVRQLMVFARQDRQPEFQAVVLSAVVNETAGICRRTFDRKISILLSTVEDLSPVWGDPGQLGQVLMNLLLNARDALKDSLNGQPRIEVAITAQSITAADQAIPPDLRRGSYLCIQVKDNGIGMDEETVRRIFEPFFSTKEVGKGTGLGLSTAHSIIQQHNGWITCDSELNVGTTFSVCLPLAQHEVAASEVATEAEQPSGMGTILFIDDEDPIRRQVKRGLEPYGYTVLTGEDGPQGLEIYRQERDCIDLVLLDLSMPGMSGQEVLTELQGIDTKVKVVLLTGYAASADQFEGAAAIIQKPVMINTLANAVRQILKA